MSSKRKPGIYLAWRTVTYRSVALMVLGGVLLFSAGMHFAFPQFTDNGIKQVSKLSDKLLERIAGDGIGGGDGNGVSRQAHFTNLDGTIKVKKASSNSWVTADYSLPLEKVLQNAPETDGPFFKVPKVIGGDEDSAG